jgi:hypothetical protein
MCTQARIEAKRHLTEQYAKAALIVRDVQLDTRQVPEAA